MKISFDGIHLIIEDHPGNGSCKVYCWRDRVRVCTVSCAAFYFIPYTDKVGCVHGLIELKCCGRDIGV